MFLLETERIRELLKSTEGKLALTQEELSEAGIRYEDMKQEYEAVEEQVDTIDESIEHAKNQLNETTMLKQQLENKIALLKEQINSAHMNDEHYAQRALTIQSETGTREQQLKELGKERESLQTELKERKAVEDAAREELIEVQSRIAALSDGIEKNKSDIIELLNNRASQVPPKYH